MAPVGGQPWSGFSRGFAAYRTEACDKPHCRFARFGTLLYGAFPTLILSTRDQRKGLCLALPKVSQTQIVMALAMDEAPITRVSHFHSGKRHEGRVWRPGATSRAWCTK